MMRVAYPDPYAVPGLRPAGLQMLQMADAMAQAGAMVDLVTPATALPAEAVLGRPANANLRFAHLPDYRKRWFFPFSSHKPFFLQCLAWLRRERPDAVYIRNIKLAAWLLPRLPGVPLYFETHELFAQTFFEEHGGQLSGSKGRKHRLLREREGLVYREAAGLFALTRALADDIASQYGTARSVTVLPDGVDLALADAARGVAQDNHQSRAVTRVLYLGSLHPWKGVDVAVHALPKTRSVELWIGGGESGRIAELRALAAQLGCADRIRFLGKIPPPERFHLIDQCDICLLPLRDTSIGARYTSPLKLFEYMAMGKPVIASDLPSVREIVRHGENGWLCRAGDADALADAISTLVAAPPMGAALGERAGRDARDYAWVRRAERALAAMKRGA